MDISNCPEKEQDINVEVIFDDKIISEPSLDSCSCCCVSCCCSAVSSVTEVE